MSTPEINAAVARERATQDIEDILHLKENRAWTRYWLRRVQQRRDDAVEKILHDSKITHEQREGLRQSVLAYEGLLKMPDEDLMACKSALG